MQVIVVSQQQVRRLLPMAECIEVMAGALETLARDGAINPLRSALLLPGKIGLLGMMPSFLEEPPAVGIKVVTVFPGNHGTRFDAHQGAVLLFETRNGCLLAIIDASEITAIRTAAVSGLATRLLAREEAADLAILGTGVQARTHLQAMLAARPLRRVRVWSRNPEHVRAFAERQSTRHGIEVEAATSARQAIEGADIICTTTSSKEPVLEGEWLSVGAHINAVGSSIRSTRELDTDAVVRSRLFVDRRKFTVNEAGDFLFPKQEGAIDDAHIRGEIGEILLGRCRGRESNDEITLFKSLGLAVEDLAAAHHVYQKAVETGLGTRIDFGGSAVEDD
ncbi:MAG: ornithine cyclodeaminase family protein [Acidobacteriota bacterium]